MGDAPIAYVEGAGGTRVAEDQIVVPERNEEFTFSNADAKRRYCPSRLADKNDFDANFPTFHEPKAPTNAVGGLPKC
jgi:hypothetical protein